MEQLQKKTWNSKAVAEHTRLPSFNKKADKLNEVLKEYSRKTFEYHWNLSHLSPWNMVLKSLKISYKQEWSERLCLQFQSCFVLLDSYIKNMGFFIQIEWFQLEGTYSYHLVQLPDQCGLNIFFPTQKSWCKSIKFTKLDQILLSPQGMGMALTSLGKLWTVLLPQKWLRAGERGWRKGEVTFPPLHSCFIPRPPHSGNDTGMEPVSQGILCICQEHWDNGKASPETFLLLKIQRNTKAGRWRRAVIAGGNDRAHGGRKKWTTGKGRLF